MGEIGNGGHYYVNGRWVDANGNPVSAPPPVEPPDPPVDLPDSTAIWAELNTLDTRADALDALVQLLQDEYDGLTPINNIIDNRLFQMLTTMLPQMITANELTIGSVIEGEASASITGEPPNQVLNLVIPPGADGEMPDSTAIEDALNAVLPTMLPPMIPAPIPGHTPTNSELTALITPLIPPAIPGANGATPNISIGSVTTGASASATLSGSSPNYTLNLVLPKGDPGTNAPAPTLTIGTVSTGAAGSSAVASLTGSGSAYTLNITIPRGDTGAAGTTDHSLLTNLATGDPHTQYLNNTRGDARYGQLGAINTWTQQQRVTGTSGNGGQVGIATFFNGTSKPILASSKGLLALLGANMRILYIED